MAYDFQKMTDDQLFEMADKLYYGKDGFDQDLTAAALAVKTAADRGNAGAMCDFGSYLMNGEGVEKDEAAAVEYWKRSAEQDFPAALHKLGMCALRGLCGVEKNEAEAAAYFKRAAEGGDRESIFTLGMLYDNGLGVEKDPRKALEYLQKASELKQPDACFLIGTKLLTLDGISQERAEEAMGMLLTAAEAGQPAAQFMYGMCCESGRGVEQDLAEAAGWYRRAARSGVAEANQALMRLGFPGVQ